MGATAHVKSISPATLAILQSHPSAIELFTCCYPPAVPPGFPAEMRDSFLPNPDLQASRRESQEWLREDFPAFADALMHEAHKPYVYLDKAWEALTEFLQSRPNGHIVGRSVFGGTDLGPNLGYACARTLGVDEVRDVAAALQSVDGSGLPHQVLRDLLEELKVYYRETALSGRAILQHLA